MADDKTKTFVRRLINANNLGKLDWKTDANPGEFVVAFPRYSVKIGMERSINEDDNQDVVLSIMSGFGEVMETIRDSDFPRHDLGEDAQGYSFFILKSLYESARRKALGVEQALDDLISELPPESEF